MITPILVFIYDRKKKASPKRAASVELRLTLERISLNRPFQSPPLILA